MSAYSGATLMITGGTGSFGNTVLKHFLTSDIGEIRIFSRDEKKQDDMRHDLQARFPEFANKVKFYIGDVRNAQSVKDAMPGVDYIFHAAALKQVPSCEFFPMQAVQTNVIGTDNVLDAAIEAGVKCVILAPTTMLTEQGQRVKTDSRDAHLIAQCLSYGGYHPVYIHGNDALR